MTFNPHVDPRNQWKVAKFSSFLNSAEIVHTSIGIVRVSDLHPSATDLRSLGVTILAEDGGLTLRDGKTYSSAPNTTFTWTSNGLNLENAKGRNFPVRARKTEKTFESSLNSWSESASQIEEAIFESYISGSIVSVQPYDVAYETKVHDLIIKKMNLVRKLKLEVDKVVETLHDEADKLFTEHEQNYLASTGANGRYKAASANRPANPESICNFKLAF